MIDFLVQVYKVVYPYTPRKEDELELVEDDFVFVSTADQGQTGMNCSSFVCLPFTHCAFTYFCTLQIVKDGFLVLHFCLGAVVCIQATMLRRPKTPTAGLCTGISSLQTTPFYTLHPHYTCTLLVKCNNMKLVQYKLFTLCTNTTFLTHSSSLS